MQDKTLFFAKQKVLCTVGPGLYPLYRALREHVSMCEYMYIHHGIANGIEFDKVYSAKLPTVLIRQTILPSKLIIMQYYVHISSQCK